MKKLLSKMDIWLLALTIIYSILGLIMIYSSSSVSTVLRYNVPQYYFFVRQAIFLVIAFIIGLVILNIPTSKYKYASYVLAGVMILVLIFVLVYGSITNNAKSWFSIGPISVQPSEFAKSVCIIFLACAYSNLEIRKDANIYNYLIPITVCLVMVFLVMLQPDLGTAIILLGIIGLIFISLPFVRKNMGKVIKIGLVVVAIIGAVVLYSGNTFLNSTQLARFEFRNPCSRYQENTGYQVCNGFIAIHNGGLFGVGLGNSSQKHLFLPESHTDFIFPIIVEELGAIVGVLIIIGYMIMLYRILKIAREGENLRLSILAYGVFAYLLLHILVNILGVLALIPLTGVPLPLLSYGGSFTLNVVVMLFVVQKVNIENKKLKNKRELAGISS